MCGSWIHLRLSNLTRRDAFSVSECPTQHKKEHLIYITLANLTNMHSMRMCISLYLDTSMHRYLSGCFFFSCLIYFLLFHFLKNILVYYSCHFFWIYKKVVSIYRKWTKQVRSLYHVKAMNMFCCWCDGITERK